jgi:hypothetical protein
LPSKENVWVSARGAGELSGGEPTTVPGYHWPWSLDETETFSELKRGAVAKGTLFGYRVSFDSALRTRWPAVMGLQGPDAGHLSAPGFAAVRPASLAVAHRLFIVDEKGVPLENVRAAGAGVKPCGVGCLDFSNGLTFLDTPVSYARKALHLKVGNKVTFAFAVTSEKGKAKADALFSGLGGAERVDAFFTDLQKRWGSFGDGYLVHVALRGGCRFQGLEHAFSTALAFGVDCAAPRESRDFAGLVAHEVIHAWNVKRIAPREHDSYEWGAFPGERNRQLYFFEGFTEGLARLELATRFADKVTLEARLEQWNATFDALRLLGTTSAGANRAGKTMESLSLESPSHGYVLGAWLAARAALVALEVHGPDAAGAHARVKDVLTRLSKQSGLPAAVDSRDVAYGWTFQPYRATLDVAEATRKRPRGYDKALLRAAFRDALGLSNTHPFLAEFFGATGPFPTADSLDVSLRAAAVLTGLEARAEGEAGSGTGGARVTLAAPPEPRGSSFPF